MGCWPSLRGGPRLAASLKHSGSSSGARGPPFFSPNSSAPLAPSGGGHQSPLCRRWVLPMSVAAPPPPSLWTVCLLSPSSNPPSLSASPVSFGHLGRHTVTHSFTECWGITSHVLRLCSWGVGLTGEHDKGPPTVLSSSSWRWGAPGGPTPGGPVSVCLAQLHACRVWPERGLLWGCARCFRRLRRQGKRQRLSP